MINITDRIKAIRSKLFCVNLILKCKKEGKYTHKQEIIQEKLRRLYGSRKDRLIEVETRLRHDLSVQSKTLRDKKAISERQRINSLFYSSPKNVCRWFRKNGRIDVEKTPPKKDVNSFSENIWSKQGTFNQEGEWLQEVRKDYCKDVETNIRDIKYEHFVKINENLKDSISPGLDQVTGFWIKRGHCTRKITFEQFRKISYGESSVTDLLIKARTTLVAKTKATQDRKNDRPIACENIMLKTYTRTFAKLIKEQVLD